MKLLRLLFRSRFSRFLWPALALVLVAVILVEAEEVSLRWPFHSDAHTSLGHRSPTPDEFLYLDSERVYAYLAQFQGGTTTSKSLSQKLTNTFGGKFSVSGFEADGSREKEEEQQSTLAPTAASSFIVLLETLEEENELRHPTLLCFQCRDHLREGEFVLFRTNAMRPPIYVNPYLAVEQSVTLSALFPTAGLAPDQRETILAERQAARKFASQVGADPRIVFDLRVKLRKGESLEYLLPVTFAQLTGERSLIKYGGGGFTVLGKVVRIFPERGQHSKEKKRQSAYVDSATRETWRRPLENAIARLICSSDPACVEKTREVKGKTKSENRMRRERAIKATREEMENSLRAQTQIASRGAVILPIAIYK